MQNSSLSAGCKNFRTHGLMLCLALLLIPRLSWCAEVSLEKVRLAYPSRSLSALPAFSSEPTVDREGIRHNLEMMIQGGLPVKVSDPDHYVETKLVDEIKREAESVLK